MSAFTNIESAFGSLGNAMGIQGDGPGGLNLLQRASLSPEQSALMNLSQNEDFQNASPDQQQMMIAQATGNPGALNSAIQMKATAAADLSQPASALQNLKAFMTPDQITSLMTNPLASGMVGGGGGNPLPSPSSPVPQAARTSFNNTYAPQGGATPQINPNVLGSTAPSTQGVNTALIASHPSPLVRGLANAFIYGAKQLPTGTEAKSPLGMAAEQLAFTADPSLAATGGTSRVDTVDNFTKGDGSKAETSLNTMIGHLYDMHQLAPTALRPANSSPAGNFVKNLVGGGIGLAGTQARSLYNTYLEKYSEEAAKYYGGGTGSDTLRDNAKTGLQDYNPSDTVQNNVIGQIGQALPKLNTLQQQYNTGMGNAATKQLLHPDSAALVADMQGQPLTPQQQQMVNAHRAESKLEPKQYDKLGRAVGTASAGGSASAAPAPQTPAPAAAPGGSAPAGQDPVALMKQRGYKLTAKGWVKGQ